MLNSLPIHLYKLSTLLDSLCAALLVSRWRGCALMPVGGSSKSPPELSTLMHLPTHSYTHPPAHAHPPAHTHPHPPTHPSAYSHPSKHPFSTPTHTHDSTHAGLKHVSSMGQLLVPSAPPQQPSIASDPRQLELVQQYLQAKQQRQRQRQQQQPQQQPQLSSGRHTSEASTDSEHVRDLPRPAVPEGRAAGVACSSAFELPHTHICACACACACARVCNHGHAVTPPCAAVRVRVRVCATMGAQSRLPVQLVDFCRACPICLAPAATAAPGMEHGSGGSSGTGRVRRSLTQHHCSAGELGRAGAEALPSPPPPLPPLMPLQQQEQQEQPRHAGPAGLSTLGSVSDSKLTRFGAPAGLLHVGQPQTGAPTTAADSIQPLPCLSAAVSGVPAASDGSSQGASGLGVGEGGGPCSSADADKGEGSRAAGGGAAASAHSTLSGSVHDLCPDSSSASGSQAALSRHRDALLHASGFSRAVLEPGLPPLLLLGRASSSFSRLDGLAGSASGDQALQQDKDDIRSSCSSPSVAHSTMETAAHAEDVLEHSLRGSQQQQQQLRREGFGTSPPSASTLPLVPARPSLHGALVAASPAPAQCDDGINFAFATPAGSPQITAMLPVCPPPPAGPVEPPPPLPLVARPFDPALQPSHLAPTPSHPLAAAPSTPCAAAAQPSSAALPAPNALLTPDMQPILLVGPQSPPLTAQRSPFSTASHLPSQPAHAPGLPQAAVQQQQQQQQAASHASSSPFSPSACALAPSPAARASSVPASTYPLGLDPSSLPHPEPGTHGALCLLPLPPVTGPDRPIINPQVRMVLCWTQSMSAGYASRCKPWLDFQVCMLVCWQRL